MYSLIDTVKLAGARTVADESMIISITSIPYEPDFKLINGTPYLAFTGELWSVNDLENNNHVMIKFENGYI